MKFDDVTSAIGTLTDLRRVAGAHVVDHRQLADKELRDAIIKVKPQYLHEDTVKGNLEQALYQDPRTEYRVLSQLLLEDVLLNQYGFSLSFSQTEEHVIGAAQAIINQSNETGLLEMACGNKSSQLYHDLEVYICVLTVAWENQNTKSPDEVNLLRNLRSRLHISDLDHRLLEAKLGKYPKPANELPTRSDIQAVRRYLQGLGLLFPVRQSDEIDRDVIPEELAAVMRRILEVELRTESYRELMTHRPLRSKSHPTDILARSGVEFRRHDTIDNLVDRVIRHVPPSKAVASSSPRFGLNSEQLAAWCRKLGISASGSIEERVARIIAHFDQLRPQEEAEPDERARWYEFYEELARRDYDALRSQHVIDKDIEIEAKFEEATRYLFARKLKHTPLQQAGTNHPDGLLSLQNMYLMWDNKSKEGPVHLKEHLAQFDNYMEHADKGVPVFLVIAPEFTEESESEAIRYHSQHFNRNIVLITSGELKELAEEWASETNKNREEPFPLGLLAATGRFDRRRLGKF